MRKLFLIKDEAVGGDDVLVTPAKGSCQDIIGRSYGKSAFFIADDDEPMSLDPDEHLVFPDGMVRRSMQGRFILVKGKQPEYDLDACKAWWSHVRKWQQPAVFRARRPLRDVTLTIGRKAMEMVETTATNRDFRKGNLVFFFPEKSFLLATDATTILISAEGTYWIRKYGDKRHTYQLAFLHNRSEHKTFLRKNSQWSF